MGIFGFFSKEKKESLDQGLQKTNIRNAKWWYVDI